MATGTYTHKTHQCHHINNNVDDKKMHNENLYAHTNTHPTKFSMAVQQWHISGERFKVEHCRIISAFKPKSLFSHSSFVCLFDCASLIHRKTEIHLLRWCSHSVYSHSNCRSTNRWQTWLHRFIHSKSVFHRSPRKICACHRCTLIERKPSGASCYERQTHHTM